MTERAAVLRYIARAIERYPAAAELASDHPGKGIRAALKRLHAEIEYGEHLDEEEESSAATIGSSLTGPIVGEKTRKGARQPRLPGVAFGKGSAAEMPAAARGVGRPATALRCGRCEGRGWSGRAPKPCTVCGGLGAVAVSRVAREAATSRATIYRILSGERVSRETCIAVLGALSRRFS